MSADQPTEPLGAAADPASPQDRVSVIATDRTWIEGDAVAQLERVGALAGMRRAVGQPDLHPGPGAPIGAAFLADVVYPHLVGGDIGCGVAVWLLPVTDRVRRDLRPDRIGRVLAGLDRVRPGDLDDGFADRFGAEADDALGTIGGGNHFLEIGRVDEVFDDGLACDAGLDERSVVLLVHTGSRGRGRQVLLAHTAAHGADPCPDGELEAYLDAHDRALRFAVANRAAVAARSAARLGVDLDVTRPLVDLTHNSVTRVDGGWLHRKGAAPNEGGLIALPGSRGSRSHLVASTPDEAARAAGLWSVAHGAGRKFSRSDARDRFGDRSRQELRTTRFGSTVICTDPTLLAEEAPGAYKDIEDVVGALVDARLVTPVVALAPIATYKTERGGAGAEARGTRELDRATARDRRERAAAKRGGDRAGRARDRGRP